MSTADTQAAAVPAAASRWPWLLVALLLLALPAAGGWWLWQKMESTTETLEAEDALIRRLSQQLRGMETEQLHLARRLDDSEGTAQRAATALATVQAQQQAALEGIAAIEDTLKGGRARYQLAAVEELLLLAHDRVALSRDVAGAVTALELAESRLAALNDPRLLPVRETLTRERLALLSAVKPDVSGAALTLGGLIERAGGLPLASRIPQRGDAVVAPEAAAAPLPADAEWPQRLMAGIKDALGAVFRIQRESRPVDRLLPPEQEALIHHIFVLKLEAARLALLRQQAATWRDLLREAQGWLAQYYAGGDARVMAAAAELERLAALDPAPRLAAPRQALEQLRAAAVLGR